MAWCFKFVIYIYFEYNNLIFQGCSDFCVMDGEGGVVWPSILKYDCSIQYLEYSIIIVILLHSNAFEAGNTVDINNILSIFRQFLTGLLVVLTKHYALFMFG